MTDKKMIKVKVFRIELDNPPVGERVFAVDVITRKLVYDYLDKLSHSELPMGLVVCSDTTAIKIGTKCHVEGHNDDINAIHTCIGFTEKGDVEMDNGLPYKKDKTHAVIGAYPYVDNIARVQAHFIPKWLEYGRMETFCEYSMQDNELRPTEENGFLNLELKQPDADPFSEFNLISLVDSLSDPSQSLEYKKQILKNFIVATQITPATEADIDDMANVHLEHLKKNQYQVLPDLFSHDTIIETYKDAYAAGQKRMTKCNEEKVNNI